MSMEMLSREEIAAAIGRLLNRIKEIEAKSSERFPLYRLADRPWTLSSGGSWMGGFWAGVWWLKAFKTRCAIDHDIAIKICRWLENKRDSATLQRSLIFNYGAGLGSRLFNDPFAKDLYQLAGQSIAKSGQSKLGFIPLGRDMGGGLLGEHTFSIDPLASTLSLLCATGHRELASQQMSTALKVCYVNNGQWHADACYQSGRFTYQYPGGDWARGQAWAMLALTQAVHLFGEDYLPIAQQSAEYWSVQYSNHLPVNRLSQRDSECDPCASVMASIAMIGLARLMTGGEWLRLQALRQLATVVRSAYFINGRFVGHCYRVSDKEERCVESPCGIFFLLAALMVADEQLDPLWV